MNERYEDESSTLPDINLDLLLEGESFGGRDRNRVFGLSNTMTENLWTTLSASVIGCFQSILSSQTLKFATMLDQRVQDQTTHLNDKYERLIVGSCVPPNWLYGSGDDLPPPPPAPPIFYIYYILFTKHSSAYLTNMTCKHPKENIYIYIYLEREG